MKKQSDNGSPHQDRTAHGKAGGDADSPPLPDMQAGPADDIGEAELFAKISHEVRTPLNSIIGFSELMKAETFGPLGHEKYRGYVEDICLSAKHALSLINDLLDISKLHAGAFDIQTEPIDVNIVAAQCVSAMDPMAQQADIDLSTTLQAELPLIMADPRALKQILFNVLSNAIKFTHAGGSVLVSTYQPSDSAVVLRVEDSGVGMTDAEVDRAFEPFRQLDTVPNTATRPQAGTGLGLPLARALAEASGASFDLFSEAGRGTCVDVSFGNLLAARP